MAIVSEAPPLQPWVEGIAAHIGDPVRRLRFLQAVGPMAQSPGARRSWRRAAGTVAVLFAMLAVLALLLRPRAVAGPPPVVETPVRVQPAAHVDTAAAAIWQVDRENDWEIYSNGLRINGAYAVEHRPRTGGGPPAGIVYHSTESQQVPFEAGHNDRLKRIGESLLDYVRRRRSYHFLIDRFGRVYRVVRESDAANHAGHSIWADERRTYVGLNESFLGIAIESQGDAPMTRAQVRSAAMLTEMLRGRYRIPARNCVAHAQVSVSPATMRVGYHVDWAGGLPYAELGLPDNYAEPLPAIWAYGFEWDPAFVNAGELRPGVQAAARMLQEAAAGAGLTVAAYRKKLQERYRAGTRWKPAREARLTE